MQSPPRIAVLGAGSIGCHLGGRLSSFAQVTLIGRPEPMSVLRELGLTLTDRATPARHVPAAAVRIASEPEAVADADFVLITVKSGGTAAAARSLAPHLKEQAVICSFQNGLHNAAELRRELPRHTVLAGMVPYNVLQTAPGHFHQGSAGALMLDDLPQARPLLAALTQAGLAAQTRTDMPEVMHAKLLANLNNAINALSGLPLRRQLGQREYRACLAACQREALAAFRAEGISPARITAIPPALTPRLLTLPDPLFRRIAARVLDIDEHARSSMWEDLQRGRPTEIDFLQGEIVAMAARNRLRAPVSEHVVELIRRAERSADRDATWSGTDLLAELAARR